MPHDTHLSYDCWRPPEAALSSLEASRFCASMRNRGQIGTVYGETVALTSSVCSAPERSTTSLDTVDPRSRCEQHAAAEFNGS